VLLVLGAYVISAWIVAGLNPTALRMVGLNEIGRSGTEHRVPLVVLVVLAPQIVGAGVGGFLLGYSSRGVRLRWLCISLLLLLLVLLNWQSMLTGDLFAGSHGIAFQLMHTMALCVPIAGGVWAAGWLKNRAEVPR
jgi:hypothetical protein